MNKENYDVVVHYHEQTKHHFGRFAKSLGYMDWQNQPNPFRFYEGTTAISLPFLQNDPSSSHLDLYRRAGNQPKLFSMENISGFLELSLALSAWKAVQNNQWSLRINPSSGNLHPTECHLVLPVNSFNDAGVFHYNPFTHSLELRAKLPAKLLEKISEHFGTEGFLVALSSIFWRESWKYGERAFRYCNHDVGHALACMSFSANLQGWKIKSLNSLSDDQIGTILGFDKVKWVELEKEYPEVLCFVCSNEAGEVARHLSKDVIEGFSQLSYTGTPNVLSSERVHWQIIDEVAASSKKPQTTEQRYNYGQTPFYPESISAVKAATVIRQRRSAVSFGGRGILDKSQFMAILDKTIPRDEHAPFDLELISPSIHLLIFVHGVRDLSSGLYFFFRNADDIEEFKNLSSSDLLWERVEEGFPLFLLRPGNFRRTASRVSCDQEIAGSSVFSLGMISKFQQTLESEPYRYRHLFWESGMIGQIFYLEAEAHGLRGTGIGCFYDNPVHEILGLSDHRYQSLYHFTVGDPVDDPRLTTYPPYAHLR